MSIKPTKNIEILWFSPSWELVGLGKPPLPKRSSIMRSYNKSSQKKLWLSANQDLNQIEILKRAIAEAGGDHLAAGNIKTTLERVLTEALKGHKTLLIMDDVWDHHVWEDVLRTPLLNATLAHGSRVLVTTRHDTVAQGMSAEKPYHRINKLEPGDAWLRLKKQVVGNGNNDAQQVDTLRDIGTEIIAKCDGLPLAIKVMGGILRQRKTLRSDWEKVLNDSIWSVFQMPGEINNVVYLSYQDLHPNLKPCFLHYALLPKSTLFWANTIVAMWISEGYVHGNSCDLEVLGLEYYNQLITRNLIEPHQRATMDQRVCNMHDVVRSFAQYVARHEAVIAHESDARLTDKLNSQNVIRLSLETKELESKEVTWSSIQAHISLRTLILVGKIKINPGDSLSSFSCFWTLHIQGGNFDALSKDLVKLKHLRYLHLGGTDTSRLPEKIGKMKFLQYISLAGCKHLEKLPSSIGKLNQLRHLNLHGTTIDNVPKGFDGLNSLRILCGFPVHMDVDWCSLEELGSLNQLTELGICGLEKVSSPSFIVKARLGEKLLLKSLSMSWTIRCGDEDDHRLQLVAAEELGQIEKVFDELCPLPNLENLNINGYFGQRLPRWMMSTTAVPLGSLRILMMADLAWCTTLPDGLCKLPCLELLQIRKAPAIKRVGQEFMCCSHSQQVAAMFPRLLKLTFIGMVELEEWEWEETLHAMPILEKLLLVTCKLRRLLPGLAFHARALKELCISDVKHLSSLENFPSVVYLEAFGNIDLDTIRNLPKLQKLVIVECPKMKVLEGMPALQRLNLEDYDMETVPRYLHDIKPRYLLLDCSLSLLTCIAAGKSSPEWDKFNHIQQVKAYADDEDSLRKWYVLYTREPFRFETNISRLQLVKHPGTAGCLLTAEHVRLERIGWQEDAHMLTNVCHSANASGKFGLCDECIASILGPYPTMLLQR
ncbi:hypothetical protein BS78_05G068900 [Paspalum vaginatum]|nr:hypothetical protein BS78_05G068900 [Paspalum vaginatum]